MLVGQEPKSLQRRKAKLRVRATGAIYAAPVFDEYHQLHMLTEIERIGAYRQVGEDLRLRDHYNRVSGRYVLPAERRLHQGQLPIDCACAWWMWLHTGPVPLHNVIPVQRMAQDAYALDGRGVPPPAPSEAKTYFRGTTVQAQGEALIARGYITDLYYSTDHIEIREHISRCGPVILLTPWTAPMSSSEGWYVDVSGAVQAHHTLLIRGYRRETKTYIAQNSYGMGWGRDGVKYLHEADLQALLTGECFAIAGSDKREGIVARERARPGIWPRLRTAPKRLPGITTVKLPGGVRLQLTQAASAAAAIDATTEDAATANITAQAKENEDAS